MSKKATLTEEQRYINRIILQEIYRKRVRKFTLQYSLKDKEIEEWFEQQPEKGRYNKKLIIADKKKRIKITESYTFNR